MCLIVNMRKLFPNYKYPIGSLVALVVCLVGTILFWAETYRGAQEIQNLADDVFHFLVPWIEKLKTCITCVSLFMIFVSLTMTLVSFSASHRWQQSYKNETPNMQNGDQRLHYRFYRSLGNRVVCALFWILSYMLNIGWIGILSVTIVLTSAYFAFSPICLPQAGSEMNMCFNFTMFSLMISGGKDPNAVSLILCGGPVDKFCKLTRGVMPWFWGSFAGCLVVLMGLAHHNASLAANFTHGRHAKRYEKLHQKYGSSPRRGSKLTCSGRTSPTMSNSGRKKLRAKTFKSISYNGNGALVHPSSPNIDSFKAKLNGLYSNGSVSPGLNYPDSVSGVKVKLSPSLTPEPPIDRMASLV